MVNITNITAISEDKVKLCTNRDDGTENSKKEILHDFTFMNHCVSHTYESYLLGRIVSQLEVLTSRRVCIELKSLIFYPKVFVMETLWYYSSEAHHAV
jgi:hypothetical protein